MTGNEWIVKQNAIYTSTGVGLKSAGAGWNKPERHILYPEIDKSLPHALILNNCKDNYIVLDVDSESANLIVSKIMSEGKWANTPRIKTSKGYHYVFKKTDVYKRIHYHDKTKIGILTNLGFSADFLCGSRIELLANNQINDSGVYLHTRELINFDQEIPELPWVFHPLINNKNWYTKENKVDLTSFENLEPGHRNHDNIMKWFRWFASNDIAYDWLTKELLYEWVFICRKYIPNWSTKNESEFANDIQDAYKFIGTKLREQENYEHVTDVITDYLVSGNKTNTYVAVSDYEGIYDIIIKRHQLCIAKDDLQVFGFNPRYNTITPIVDLEKFVGRIMLTTSANINPSLIPNITKGLSYILPYKEKVKDPTIIHFKNCDYKLGQGIVDVDESFIQPNMIPHNLITQEQYNSDLYAPYRTEFEKHFNTWANGENDVMIELLELIGIAMSKITVYDKAWFLYGQGSNGKGMFLRVLNRILGEHNVAHQDIGYLAKNPFAPYDLYGKLANINADIGNGLIADASVFKKTVSGDPMPAEQKGLKSFTFSPYATQIYSTNGLPHIKETGDSDGVDRRIKIIPFLARLQTGTSAIGLEDKLAHPKFLEVIIYQAVLAMDDVIINDRELTESEMGAFHRRQYFKLINNVAEFLSTIIVKSGSEVGMIFKKYRLWANDLNIKPLGYHNFEKQLLKSLNKTCHADIYSRRGVDGYPVEYIKLEEETND